MHRTAVRNDTRGVVDPFKDVTDIVEVLMIFHEKRTPRFRYESYKLSLEELYKSLTDTDVSRLFSTLNTLIADKKLETVTEICIALVAFKNCELHDLHEALINANCFYPGVLYKNASDQVAEILLARLEDPESNRNHLLCALAWIGSERVVSPFHQWKTVRPDWADQLYVDPWDYSKEAGWTLDVAGEKSMLYSEECFALTPSTEGTTSINSFTQSDEQCPWCQSPLMTLFNLDTTLLGLDRGTIEVKTCCHCSAYAESLFMELDKSGKATWSSSNEKPDFLPEDMDDEELPKENALYLSKEKQTSLHGVNAFVPTKFSQIGGAPTWMQDASYPTCPKCQKIMQFIGQIDNADVLEYGEGIYSNFVCFDCSVTATGYEQT